MAAPAGIGWKDFGAGDVLTSAQVDGYLMAQSIMRFASAAARDAILTGANAPVEGMHCTLDDSDKTFRYTGSAWAEIGGISATLIDAVGDLIVGSAADTAVRMAVGSDFRYLKARAAATNGLEWADLATVAEVLTQQSTTSSPFVDLATAGPAVTVTTGAKALVILSCGLSNSGGAFTNQMGFAVSSATTLAADFARALHQLAPTNDRIGVSRCISVTGLTPGSNVFTAKYAVTGGTGQFHDRQIAVIPF